MSEVDTLRWGDFQALVFTIPAGSFPAGANIGTSKQLIAAHCRWPVLWGLRLAIVPSLAAAETATFTVSYKVTIGAGQGMMTAVFNYAVAPTAGVYLPINDLQAIPAQDIQVNASISGAAAAGVGVQESIQVGAFVAPYTEFHGTTRLYEWMEKSPDERTEGAERWMHGRPFDDGRLTYR